MDRGDFGMSHHKNAQQQMIPDNSHPMIASEETLHSSLTFLQNTLKSMGLSNDALNLQSNKPSDLVNTCNTIYGLLLQTQKDTKFKDQLKQELQKARLDVQAAEKERTKFETKLVAKEREIGAISNKAQAGDEARREEVTRVRRENEDLQKRTMGFERRIVQMQHEIKRKEKEFERLQERLSHYLADKKKSDTAALDMAGKLSQGLLSGGAAAAMSSSSLAAAAAPPSARAQRSDEGLKAVVAAYEGKQAELARENRDLKSALASLQAEYKNAVNAANARSAAARASGRTSGPVVEEAFIRAVPHMSADELRAELSARLKLIQQRLSGLNWHPVDAGSGSVAEQRMLADLSTARSVIRDQEALITVVLSSLREAQSHAEVQHENDVKSLVQRYQKQLAAADEEIARIMKEADEKVTNEVSHVQSDAEARIENAMQQVDAALARAEQAEKSLLKAENARKQAMEDAKHAAETKLQSEIAKARSQVEAEMQSMANESSELHLSLKREQAALRAETGALRERLVAEKTRVERANAERDSALAAVESRIQSVELTADTRAKERYDTLLNEKESLLAKAEERLRDVDARLASLQDRNRALEAQVEDAHDEVNEAKTRDAELSDELSRLRKELESVRQDAADRERTLHESKSAEVVALQRSIHADRAALVSKVEAEFAEERCLLEDKIKELERYQEMIVHYKELMGRYAPGLGAGVFLERAVNRLAQEAAGMRLVG